MFDGAKLFVLNLGVIFMMMPVVEHFGGRSLPPGGEWIFFWIGAIGLGSFVTAQGLLRLRRYFRERGLR
jgi:hypothetical protein